MMSEPQFAQPGSGIAPMIGRQTLLQRLWSDLTTQRNNLTIIGPRSIGKTVLLNALATHAANDANSPYSIVLHWHLGHVCPTTDEGFIGELCDKLRDAIGTAAGLAELRQYLGGHSYAHLKEVTDLLDSDDKRILMLWDGFDKPLGQGRLSGHLWDQMRDLFNGAGHKIVTATRAPLSDLIRNEDAITSPFWNIFDAPVRVGPFEESELRIAVEQSGIAITPGGVSELANWTANHPPLLMAFLKRLATSASPGTIDNHIVNDAAVATAEELASVLNSLWDDCPAGAKELFRLLAEREELPTDGVGQTELACLTARGFATKTGKKLKPNCRLLQAHLRQSMPDVGSLARLFGTWENYRSQIRNVLELRLKGIPNINNRLHRLVERSIEDIPDFPDDCLNNLTSIEEQALDIIWKNEFGSSRAIPPQIIAYWTAPPRDNDRQIKGMMEHNAWTVPQSRSEQLGLLQLLTGCKQPLTDSVTGRKIGFESQSKSASKDTYVLINAIHCFRNRNQHADGEQMHVGVAVAAIMTCLELLGCLARELTGDQNAC